MNRPGMSGDSTSWESCSHTRCVKALSAGVAEAGGVRMVAEISDQHESEWAAMGEVARLLGIGTAETVRKWLRRLADTAGGRGKGEPNGRVDRDPGHRAR